MAKKSKNAKIEVPDYLTQEELMKYFKESKDEQSKLHREREGQYNQQFQDKFH